MSKTVMVVIRKPQLNAIFKILDRTFSHFLPHSCRTSSLFVTPDRTFCYLGEVRYRTFFGIFTALKRCPWD